MRVRFEVSRGPETGKQAVFQSAVITIGRGPKNDLVLRDGLVSQYHGEILLQPQGTVYRDLKSRHGTLVKLNHVTVNLHDHERTQEIQLVDGAQLMLGESIVRVCVEDSPDLGTDRQLETLRDLMGDTSTHEAGLAEQVVTRSRDSIEAVARKLSSQDPRLVSIFKLSRRLNAAPNLHEILDLIIDATFEAFPAANFFAISLLPPGREENGGMTSIKPLITRERSSIHPTRSTIPLLSQSLLEQVARSRESVLFVRDRSGREVSESIIDARIMACLAAPLVGERSLIGVMQADTRGLGGLFGPDDLDLFTVMASYAAFAIERVRLNDSIVDMFEGFVRASVTAIDARDPSTAGHSERVAETTIELAQAVRDVNHGPLGPINFTETELTELRYAALLHDFGKIGVPEPVLIKAERLYPADRRAIEERFEAIRNKMAFDAQRRRLQRLLRHEQPPTAADLAAIDEEIKDITRRLERIRGDVLQLQRQEHLPDDLIARINGLADLSFTDLDGVTQPYFDPWELEHLRIPKGTLTTDEWGQIRAHARMSREYLSQIPWSDELAQIPCIAGWHHERLDGSGYPDALAGDAIPIQVRILSICDVFDALITADRPYRKAIPSERAIAMLYEEAEAERLDHDLVELFHRTVVPTLLKRLGTTKP